MKPLILTCLISSMISFINSSNVNALIGERIYQGQSFRSHLEKVTGSIDNSKAQSYLISWMIYFQKFECLSLALEMALLLKPSPKFWKMACRFIDEDKRELIWKAVSSSQPKPSLVDVISGHIKDSFARRSLETFSLLPLELYSKISSDLSLLDMINLSSSSWSLFDQIRPHIRTIACTRDRLKRRWKLSLIRVYTSYKTDERKIISLLETHEQFMSLQKYVENGEEINFHQIVEDHSSRTHRLLLISSEALVKRPAWMTWLLELDVSFDLFKIALEVAKITVNDSDIQKLLLLHIRRRISTQWIIFLITYWRVSKNLRRIDFQHLLLASSNLSIRLALFKKRISKLANYECMISLIADICHKKSEISAFSELIPLNGRNSVPRGCLLSLYNRECSKSCWKAFTLAFPNFDITMYLFSKTIKNRIFDNELVRRLANRVIPRTITLAEVRFLPVFKSVRQILLSRYLKSDINVQDSIKTLVFGLKRTMSNEFIMEVVTNLSKFPISQADKSRILKTASNHAYCAETIAFINENLIIE